MDEDSEFREMVMKKLESSGFMLKMRAKLRANIYHAIDQDLTTSTAKSHAPIPASSQDCSESQDISEMTVKPDLAPADEAMALYLVQDLLDCLNLNYTSSVFKMESGTKSNRTRTEICEALKISVTKDEDAESYIAADNTTIHSDIIEESIAGQTIIKMNAKHRPLLMEVLRTLADLPGRKLNESTTSNADEYNDQTFITTSAQNTTANQTSESL